MTGKTKVVGLKAYKRKGFLEGLNSVRSGVKLEGLNSVQRDVDSFDSTAFCAIPRLESAWEINTQRIKNALEWRKIFNPSKPLFDSSMFFPGMRVRRIGSESVLGVVSPSFDSAVGVCVALEQGGQDYYYPNQLEVFVSKKFAKGIRS